MELINRDQITTSNKKSNKKELDLIENILPICDCLKKYKKLEEEYKSLQKVNTDLKEQIKYHERGEDSYYENAICCYKKDTKIYELNSIIEELKMKNNINNAVIENMTILTSNIKNYIIIILIINIIYIMFIIS